MIDKSWSANPMYSAVRRQGRIQTKVGRDAADKVGAQLPMIWGSTLKFLPIRVEFLVEFVQRSFRR